MATTSNLKMHISPFLILCIYFIGCYFLYPQFERASDSIKTTNYHTRFESLIHQDFKQAHTYIDSLELLKQQGHYPKATYFYHRDLAYYLFVLHKMDSSIVHFEKALKISEQQGWAQEAVSSKIWLANHHYFKNNYDDARSLYNQALSDATKIDYTDGMANAYYGLSDLEEDEEKILLFVLTIDSLYEARQQTSPILANALGAIGRHYMKSNKYEIAKKYLEKSLKVSRETNYLPGISYYPVLLGDIALQEKNFEDAYHYYNIGLDESTKKQDTLNLAHALVELASVDLETNRLLDAESRLMMALDHYRFKRDSASLTSTSLALAQLFIKKRQFNEARSFLKYAEQNPIYLSEKDYRFKLLTTSIAYYEQIGDFRNALGKQKALDILKTADFEARNTEAFMKLEQRYNSDKKEQEITLLKTQNQLVEQQKKNQRNLLLSGIGITSLIGIFLFFLYRNREKTMIKLKEIDTLKSNFFANISHEFRTPLTLIAAPLEEKLESSALDDEERTELQLMQRNSKRLLNLVDQMLDLSKLESGKFQLHISQGNLGELLRALGASFNHKAQQNNIDYEVRINSLTQVWFDRDVIEKITINLLSNAFKYNKKDGVVRFVAKETDYFMELSVTNSDDSVAPENAKYLFERFYQQDSHMEGAGIGLSLVKELVELNHGSIKVIKPSSDLLQFKISLPVDKSAFSTQEIKQFSVTRPQVAEMIAEPLSVETIDLVAVNDRDEDADILLVIEDHMEVRQLIKKIFSPQYQVIEAADGQEGLSGALRWVPDVIVSDIMMPGMDGLEVCQKLKTDERTSHIPVILLTAKAGEEDQYAGLSSGADAYITKPFTTKLLKTKLNNLVASRKALRDRYSQEIILKPKDIAITDLDERFLQKVQDVLGEKLTESSFNIQEFSNAVGMSRMQLHRKLKALTGLSASEFVRSQRLKLAADLLQKSNANVSEIGYQVGFNDPSYFTKCFRDAYGCSPSDYIKKFKT